MYEATSQHQYLEKWHIFIWSLYLCLPSRVLVWKIEFSSTKRLENRHTENTFQLVIFLTCSKQLTLIFLWFWKAKFSLIPHQLGGILCLLFLSKSFAQERIHQLEGEEHDGGIWHHAGDVCAHPSV